MNPIGRGELAPAIEALDAGQARHSLRVAHRVLARAIKTRDRHLQGCASLVMSQAFVLRSRMELGFQFGTRAAALFDDRCDPHGAAEALSVQSYCASALGRSDEAVLAASRAIALRADRQADASTGIGLNYLGVASFWAGDFGTARGALDASVWYCEQQEDWPLAYQPLVNACFTEVLRATHAEASTGGGQDLSDLRLLVAKASDLRTAGARGFVRGGTPIGLLLLDFCDHYLAQKSGHAGAAERAFNDCVSRAAAMPRTSWVRAIPWWARVERMKADGNIAGAVHSARAMGALARTGQHQGMAGVAALQVARLLGTVSA